MHCLRLQVLLVVASIAAGCSRGRVNFDDASYDSPRAKETLVAALDAWQQGRVRELSRRDPAIRFADDDCASGRKLDSYELLDPGAPVRPFSGVAVRLVLRGQGQLVERLAIYQVTLAPQISVLRSDP